MKIEIEVSDFWIDSEYGFDLEKTLKQFIIKSSVASINKSIEEQVKTAIVQKTRDVVEKRLGTTIQKVIDECVKSGKIEDRNGSATIEEFIRKRFMDNSNWNNPNETIKKIAEQLGKELKARYDIMFASQIVAKLNENGMLKPDVARILLEEKK